MKIALWNVERLQKNKTQKIIDILLDDNADIIVLTEANKSIDLTTSHPFVLHTQNLHKFAPDQYTDGEVRVMIYAKYPIKDSYTTYDPFTTLCADIETPHGTITMYACIIGVLGGNGPGRKGYISDLNHQLKEYKALLHNKNACIIGDLNTSFTGFPYPSIDDQKALKEVFQELNMTNLSERYIDLTITDEKNINVDHIVISKDFLKKVAIVPNIWNINKKLSDHIGFSIRFNE